MRMNLTTALGESAVFGYQGCWGFSTLRDSLATPNDRSVDALPNPKSAQPESDRPESDRPESDQPAFDRPLPRL